MRAAWVISVVGTEEIFTHESGSAKDDALQSKLPRQVHNADQSHASERERLDADLGNWSNVHLRALITIVKYNVPDKVCLHWTFAFTFKFFVFFLHPCKVGIFSVCVSSPTRRETFAT